MTELNRTTISREEKFCIWYCKCVVKLSTTPVTSWSRALCLRGGTEHDTNDIVTIKGIVFAWWNRARHQCESQDPEKQHEAQHEFQQWPEHEAQHESQQWPEHVSVRMVFAIFVVSIAVVTLISCTSDGSRCSSVCFIPSHGHCHACVKWAFFLTSLISSSLSSSFSHSSWSSYSVLKFYEVT